jgi:hypothetical protein
MKKLLLLLLLSLGLINFSFAGVKDISLKCENGFISESWKVKNSSWFSHPSNNKDPGAFYKTDLIITTDSDNSVSMNFTSHFKYSEILSGKIRLDKETADFFRFNKKIKYENYNGWASLVIDRHEGRVTFLYEIDDDDVYEDGDGTVWPIDKKFGGFYQDNWECKKHKRLF